MRTFTLEFRRGIAGPVLVSGREPHKSKVKPERIPHQILEWALTRPTPTGRYRSEADWADIIGCADQPEVERVTRHGAGRAYVTVTHCGCNVARR
jgi:hypothetical protein